MSERNRLDTLINSSSPAHLAASGIVQWAELCSQFWRITSDGSCRLYARNKSVTIVWLKGLFGALVQFMNQFLVDAVTEEMWIERGQTLHNRRCFYVFSCFCDKRRCEEMMQGHEDKELVASLYPAVCSICVSKEIFSTITQLYIVMCNLRKDECAANEKELWTVIVELMRSLCEAGVPQATEVARMLYSIKLEVRKEGCVLKPREAHSAVVQCAALAAISTRASTEALSKALVDLWRCVVSRLERIMRQWAAEGVYSEDSSAVVQSATQYLNTAYCLKELPMGDVAADHTFFCAMVVMDGIQALCAQALQCPTTNPAPGVIAAALLNTGAPDTPRPSFLQGVDLFIRIFSSWFPPTLLERSMMKSPLVGPTSSSGVDGGFLSFSSDPPSPTTGGSHTDTLWATNCAGSALLSEVITRPLETLTKTLLHVGTVHPTMSPVLASMQSALFLNTQIESTVRIAMLDSFRKIQNACGWGDGASKTSAMYYFTQILQSPNNNMDSLQQERFRVLAVTGIEDVVKLTAAPEETIICVAKLTVLRLRAIVVSRLFTVLSNLLGNKQFQDTTIAALHGLMQDVIAHISNGREEYFLPSSEQQLNKDMAFSPLRPGGLKPLQQRAIEASRDTTEHVREQGSGGGASAADSTSHSPLGITSQLNPTLPFNVTGGLIQPASTTAANSSTTTSTATAAPAAATGKTGGEPCRRLQHEEEALRNVALFFDMLLGIDSRVEGIDEPLCKILKEPSDELILKFAESCIRSIVHHRAVPQDLSLRPGAVDGMAMCVELMPKAPMTMDIIAHCISSSKKDPAEDIKRRFAENNGLMVALQMLEEAATVTQNYDRVRSVFRLFSVIEDGETLQKHGVHDAIEAIIYRLGDSLRACRKRVLQGTPGYKELLGSVNEEEYEVLIRPRRETLAGNSLDVEVPKTPHMELLHRWQRQRAQVTGSPVSSSGGGNIPNNPLREFLRVSEAPLRRSFSEDNKSFGAELSSRSSSVRAAGTKSLGETVVSVILDDKLADSSSRRGWKKKCSEAEPSREGGAEASSDDEEGQDSSIKIGESPNYRDAKLFVERNRSRSNSGASSGSDDNCNTKQGYACVSPDSPHPNHPHHTIAVAPSTQEESTIVKMLAVISQCIVDATTSNDTRAQDTYYSSVTLIESNDVYKFAAVKPRFLDLVPAMAHVLDDVDFLTVISRIVSSSVGLDSKKLLDFALTKPMPELLNSLQVPLDLMHTLPMKIESPVNTIAFWKPLIMHGALRSELRFRNTGGVVVRTVLTAMQTGRTEARNHNTTHSATAAPNPKDGALDRVPSFSLPPLGSSVPTFGTSAHNKREEVFLSGLTVSFWFMMSTANHSTVHLAEFVLSEEQRITVTIRDTERLQATVTASGKKILTKVINEGGALFNYEPGTWVFYALIYDPVDSSISAFAHGRMLGRITGMPRLAGPEHPITIYIGPVYREMEHSVFSIGEIGVWNDKLPKSELHSVMFGCDRDGHSRKLKPIEALSVLEVCEPWSTQTMVGWFRPHVITGTSTLQNCSVAASPNCTAALSGAFFPPPRSFAEPRLLFLTLGGLRHLLQWIQPTGGIVERLMGSSLRSQPMGGSPESGSPEQNDMHIITDGLELLVEVVRNVTYVETVRPRLYCQVALFLKRLGKFLRKRHMINVIRIAAEPVRVSSKREFWVIINKAACEHILADVRLYASLEENTALHMLDVVRSFFCGHDSHTSALAKRNSDFVMGQRFTDRLLHGLVSAGNDITNKLRAAVVSVFEAAVISRGFPQPLIQSVVSACAQLCMERDTADALPDHALSLIRCLLKVLADGIGSKSFLDRFLCCVDPVWFAALLARLPTTDEATFRLFELLVGAIENGKTFRETVEAKPLTITQAVRRHKQNQEVVLMLLAASVGKGIQVQTALHGNYYPTATITVPAVITGLPTPNASPNSTIVARTSGLANSGIWSGTGERPPLVPGNASISMMSHHHHQHHHNTNSKSSSRLSTPLQPHQQQQTQQTQLTANRSSGSLSEFPSTVLHGPTKSNIAVAREVLDVDRHKWVGNKAASLLLFTVLQGYFAGEVTEERLSFSRYVLSTVREAFILCPETIFQIFTSTSIHLENFQRFFAAAEKTDPTVSGQALAVKVLGTSPVISPQPFPAVPAESHTDMALPPALEGSPAVNAGGTAGSVTAPPAAVPASGAQGGNDATVAVTATSAAATTAQDQTPRTPQTGILQQHSAAASPLSPSGPDSMLTAGMANGPMEDNSFACSPHSGDIAGNNNNNNTNNNNNVNASNNNVELVDVSMEVEEEGKGDVVKQFDSFPVDGPGEGTEELAEASALLTHQEVKQSALDVIKAVVRSSLITTPTSTKGPGSHYGNAGRLLLQFIVRSSRSEMLQYADLFVSVAVTVLESHKKQEATAVEENVTGLMDHLVDLFFICTERADALSSFEVTHSFHLVHVLASHAVFTFRRRVHLLRAHALRACVIAMQPSRIRDTLPTSLLVALRNVILCCCSDDFDNTTRSAQLFYTVYSLYMDIPPSTGNLEEEENRSSALMPLFKAVVATSHKQLNSILTITGYIPGKSTCVTSTFLLLLQDEMTQFEASLRSKEVDTVLRKGPPHKHMKALTKELEDIKVRYGADVCAVVGQQKEFAKFEQEFAGTLVQEEHKYMSDFSSTVEELLPLTESALHWLHLKDCVRELSSTTSVRHYYDGARNVVPYEAPPTMTEMCCNNNSSMAMCGSFSNNNNSSPSPSPSPARVNTSSFISKKTGQSCPPELNVSILESTINEEFITHMSIYIPPVISRIPPFGIASPPWLMAGVKVTRSALTLLQYMITPQEKVHYISNAFKVFGIHCIPVVLVLTDVTLKLFAFSRLTANGDLLMAMKPASGETSDSAAAMMASSGELERSFALTQIKRLHHTLHRRASMRQLGAKVGQSVVSMSESSPHRGLCWFYDLQGIREVRTCAYLHQSVGVDIRMGYDDGPLLALMDNTGSMNSEARKAFLKQLVDVCKRNEAFTVVDDDARTEALVTHTRQWVNRTLSTYDYLWSINKAAGRLLKDWNQYPVFPWVLNNYRSEGPIDLNNPAIYRDLQWPIHAQTPEARATAEKRYSDMLSVEEEPCHHTTHYTSSACVMHFLLRIQPFLTMSAAYQGGQLDKADRLFRDVGTSYEIATTTSADCKELIPEFYSNGTFLTNIDNTMLGNLQSGERVHDVALPPWAKGSPRLFTHIMRQALESEVVGSAIHAWIDLIFGSKQFGEGAVAKLNVHRPLTYSEEVQRRLRKETSSEGRNHIVCEVQNFGQTPRQVFTADHPRRIALAESRPLTSAILLHAEYIYALRESTVLPIPGPLLSRYCPHDRAVRSFVTLENGKLMAATHSVIPVGRSMHCLCVSASPHDCRLYRHSLQDGRQMPTVFFDAPISTSITAVFVAKRESIVLLGTSAGPVYCLTIDAIRHFLFLGNTLQAHRSPIKGICGNNALCCVLTYTVNPDDKPVLWRYMRRNTAYLHRLAFSEVVVDAFIDSRESTVVVAGASQVAIFDYDGKLLGVGYAPTETNGSVVPAITSLSYLPSHEWVDNGTLVYYTGHERGLIGVWKASRRIQSEESMLELSLVHLLATDEEDAITCVRGTAAGLILCGYRNGKVRTAFPDAERMRIAAARASQAGIPPAATTTPALGPVATPSTPVPPVMPTSASTSAGTTPAPPVNNTNNTNINVTSSNLENSTRVET